jgi:thiol-disulfide isomerase/thioredoxin
VQSTAAQTHGAHDAYTQVQKITPFNSSSFASFAAQATLTKPVIVMFWSLDCVHCSEGVALLKQVQASAQIISVATDDISLQNDLTHHLTHHGNTFPAYAFADTPEKLRYSVDKRWRGETPVFYVLKPDSRPIKFLGLPELTQLKAALFSPH